LKTNVRRKAEVSILSYKPMTPINAHYKN